jgi:hypothetical protein
MGHEGVQSSGDRCRGTGSLAREMHWVHDGCSFVGDQYVVPEM